MGVSVGVVGSVGGTNLCFEDVASYLEVVQCRGGKLLPLLVLFDLLAPAHTRCVWVRNRVWQKMSGIPLR